MMTNLISRAAAMAAAITLCLGMTAAAVPAEEALEAESVVLEPEAVSTSSASEETETEEEVPEDVSAVSAVSSVSEAEEISLDVDHDGKIVIVLDPGHDHSHTGAEAKFGDVEAHEEDLVASIARYMKRELVSYENVVVYMTHDGTAEKCPFKAESDKACLQARVDYAEKVGADYFISLHLNKSPEANVTGCEILYPNESYDTEVADEGRVLSNVISRKLQKLGLEINSVHSRNSDDEEYPDGSVADYYSVIRRSKLAGFTGIIIEHCHMDVEEEYDQYLSDNARLKALGEADAKAIAQYLDLKKLNAAEIASSSDSGDSY